MTGGTPPAIAIVGIACHYPDAASGSELWETVLGRRRAFRLLPAQRLAEAYQGTGADQTYVTHAGLLRDWTFDRERFGVPGRLFRTVDQTHWLALQTCGEALADAGFPDSAGLDRDRVGVVLGNSLTGEFSRASQLRLRWPFIGHAARTALARADVPAEQAAKALEELESLIRAPFPEPGDESLAGALSNTIAGRVCNHFDFHGTGYTVDGACASSLLAVMTACRALGSGELDFALAGGVDLSLDPFELVGFARMRALAEGGEMRVYDAEPTGFLPGEGCGVIALMRAEDAREAGLRTYAVVSGWGMSSDGSGGLTRPEESGQARALRRAYEMARVDPCSVGLVEGHGTGTPVGDRVELATLNLVRAGAPRRAVLGSVKANIGHTKAAAGAAGLIKAALAVHHGVLPPATGCREPHELLTGPDSTLRLLSAPEPWQSPAPVAAVSSMGFGGINAHVVLTGAGAGRSAVPEPMLRWGRPLPRYEIVLLTGPDRGGVAQRLDALAGTAASLSAAELHDLAATEYKSFQPNAAVRCALVAETPEHLARAAARASARISAWSGELVVNTADGFVLGGRGRCRVGLLFPGQAAPVRARLDDGVSAPDLPKNLPVDDCTVSTEVAQPAIVRQSLAALDWLAGIGCRPVAAAGHSLGEISALVWAGALTPEDGLRLAVDRGRIMAEHGRSGTGMASIGLPADGVAALLAGSGVTVAGYNAPDQTTIAGDMGELRQVLARVNGARATELPVSHAFHSSAMAPAAEPLAAVLRGTAFSTPRQRVFSTVTGSLLDGADGGGLRDLLVRQLTAPVRFTEAMVSLTAECDLLVEAGPGTTLASLVRDFPVVSLDSGGSGRGRAMTTAALAAVSVCDLGHWFGDRAHRDLVAGTPITLLANPCEVVGEVVETAEDAEPDAVDSDPLAVLRHHLSRTLELPVGGIRPDRTLLGDLHLNSLQVMQILAEVAALLGKRVPVMPPTLGEATVADVAELLGAQPSDDGSERAVLGVRPWTRAFRHTWIPWQPRPARPDVLWKVDAPDGHWLHTVAESTVDEPVRTGLAVWINAGDPVTRIAAVVRALGERRPDVVLVLHDGHPAADAVARSAEAELGCVATSVRLPVRAASVDLGLAEAGVRLRVHPSGDVERLATSVLPAGERDEVPLRPGDVCLVTGGSDGITARCAEALALRTGCLLVLLGRSAADAPRVRKGLSEIDPSVVAHYVQCDVTDPRDVRRAVELAGAHGPVRGLLHGAGVNEPRQLGEVVTESMTATLAPKVDGLRHLLDEVGDELTLLVGFGSIIGRFGLTGQSEYCVANDWMRAELTGWAARHPSCRSRVLEWSVWSGTGMGERMGVLGALRDRGIVPIEPASGVEAMIDVLTRSAAPVTLLMTGRFPADPKVFADAPPAPPLRFSSDVLVHVPGVETVVEPVISTGADLYLDDHRVDGVPVFPAVAGLEAMAQTAALLGGPRERWSFADVDLASPIVVDGHDSRALRVAGLAGDQDVDVVVSDDADGYTTARFRAVVCPAPAEPARAVVTTGPPPDEGPHPFYGPLFFHSGRLRGLIGYELLTAFEVRAWVRGGDERWFSQFQSSRLLLGDLGAHDATIHVLLACLPHRRALPVHVERVTVWRRPAGALLVSAREREHSADEYVFDVRLSDEDGLAVAQWDGLRLRAIGPRVWEDPLPVELIGPLLGRRLVECGLAGPLDVTTSAAGVTAEGQGLIGYAWDRVTDEVSADRLALAIAEKVGEPESTAATRVRCARRALGDAGAHTLAIEEVTDDGLVVLGTPDARVTTYAGPLVIALALRPGG
ncbi:SDR family NAD(P)-dependent oxidoreductase [Lentzea sp. BCCO 10_0856]|uniref:SDR family NAD(P)-dependent oxidoreductase n=1 Tax=Lentzea miocenica TaxID=3095431 RepID=A0ABU4TFX3_9PSEU|nr:SDR family NAD(P)-dependent oxidoreductase [Lentzea sp. BCCO 10_0856]MDX8037072.1 SDR family NAD(P)-dependent oxidoreductase [Lentzea sp. BCCO 10_0856]